MYSEEKEARMKVYLDRPSHLPVPDIAFAGNRLAQWFEHNDEPDAANISRWVEGLRRHRQVKSPGNVNKVIHILACCDKHGLRGPDVTDLEDWLYG